MSQNENEFSNSDDLGAPKFAAANVDKINVTDVEQLVSEVPTGTKPSTVTAQFKPTTMANWRNLARGTIFASHWLNLPLKDGEMYVNIAYQIIKTMAANYQRTHQDGFFEAWPGCLILEKDEERPGTAELRANYEDYSERLAHYIWHYANARMMLAGSLANLLIMSRLNGNAVTKDMAADCRWSRVNTNTNLYSRFPQPIGLDDFVASNSCYAIGKTSYGADILSFPMWIVDIFGNRGCHAQGFDATITTKGGLNGDWNTANMNNPSRDGLRANILLENIMDTIIEYGFDPSNVDGNSYHPRMPHIENGSISYLQDKGTANLSVSMNADGYLKEGLSCPAPTTVDHNQISATAWKNYFYWQDYMIRNFPEMLDPNSDIYVFYTTQVKLLEKSKTPKAMLDIIHSVKNVDMLDLREKMKYKSHNPATTATIVKWAPLYGGSEGVNSARDNNENSYYFDRNFHRFKTHGIATSTMLYENSVWPRLTPTAFANMNDTATHKEGSGQQQHDVPDFPETDENKAYAPFILNATPGVGREILSIDPTQAHDGLMSPGMVQSPVGKFAYMLDLASTRLADPEHGHITALGITEKALEDFVNNANGIVFDEDSSNVRLFEQPMIDNTDPFQCGFNVMISDEIVTPNEWRIFMDASVYGDATIDVPMKEVTIGSTTKQIPSGPAIKVGSGQEVSYEVAHIVNPRYLSKLKYALLFVGDGVFDHPYQNLSSNKSSLPIYEATAPANSGVNSPFKKWANKWTQPATAANPANGYEAIQQMLVSAGFIGDGDVEQVNNIAGAIYYDLLKKYDGSTDAGELIISMFNPGYGPVNVLTSTASNFAGKIPVSMFKETIGGPTQAKMTPQLAAKVNPGSMGAGFSDAKTQVIWNPVDYGVHYWMEFLSEIQFNPTKYDFGFKTYTLVREKPFDPIIFTDAGHTYRTFLARAFVQYAGCNKYNPFWDASNISESKLKTLPQTLKATFAMPENDVMAEPRIARSTKAPDKNYNDVKAKTTGWDTKSNQAKKSAFGGQKTSKNFNGKHKSANRHPSNRDRADGIEKPSDLKVPEGSAFDDSTLKEEKTSKEFTRKGKPMTGVDTQLS